MNDAPALSPRHRNPKEIAMFAKSTKILVIALALAGASLTFAADASAHRGDGGYARASAPSTEPAHIIEVRPGLWVGSYQCITDLDRGGRDCSSGN
jgi:hypothetical protein